MISKVFFLLLDINNLKFYLKHIYYAHTSLLSPRTE